MGTSGGAGITQRHFAIRRSRSNPNSSNRSSGPGGGRRRAAVVDPRPAPGRPRPAPPPASSMAREHRGHGGPGDPLAAVSAAGEDAADPPVGQLGQLGRVGLGVLDRRHLGRRPVLAPADAGVTVVDEHLVHRARPHVGLLGVAVPARRPVRCPRGGSRCTSSRPTPRCWPRPGRRSRARCRASGARRVDGSSGRRRAPVHLRCGRERSAHPGILSPTTDGRNRNGPAAATQKFGCRAAIADRGHPNFCVTGGG